MSEDNSPLMKLAAQEYYFEHSRQSDILSRLSIPVGFLSAASVALYGFFKEAPALTCGPANMVFWGILVVSATCLLLAAYHLCRAIYGHTYAFISPMEELEQFRAGWLASQEGQPLAQQTADERLLETTTKQYVEAASLNRATNNRRSNRYHLANRWTIGTLAALFLLAVSKLSLATREVGHDAERPQTAVGPETSPPSTPQGAENPAR